MLVSASSRSKLAAIGAPRDGVEQAASHATVAYCEARTEFRLPLHGASLRKAHSGTTAAGQHLLTASARCKPVRAAFVVTEALRLDQ